MDVRGPAAEVARKMGLIQQLREAATSVRSMQFVNDRGKSVGRVAMGDGGGTDVELMRTDLARILYEASAGDAEYVFHDSVSGLAQDEGGVDITFEHGSPRRFDLVVGTDGLHSGVRRLAFGPEAAFVEHRGVYVATMPLDAPVPDRSEIVMYNSPGRAVAVHPSRERGIVAFMFRHSAVPGFDYCDTAQHKRLLETAYAGAGWRVPQLLDQVRAAGDLYLDSVSRVRLPSWAVGRVVLAGDAASCVSLFGDGSTLAMSGAYTLATELAASPKDPAAAFKRYEETHRKLVNPRQRNVPVAAAILIPTTRAGIAVRNFGTRLAPLVNAAQKLALAKTA
ncbi:FAD-dependent monooxygenase [Amycolatopsis sp. NPDC023774]|uniref:FAD-dependent monooxygenase n=1 Tax=Amycolatopsis sp. NPDC023774 TaxID=3155015 RepID=UPI0033D28BB5